MPEAEWQTFEKPENKRQMYGMRSHSACVQPTALKLGRVTNFDMLFLVMGFISLIDKI